MGPRQPRFEGFSDLQVTELLEWEWEPGLLFPSQSSFSIIYITLCCMSLAGNIEHWIHYYYSALLHSFVTTTIPCIRSLMKNALQDWYNCLYQGTEARSSGLPTVTGQVAELEHKAALASILWLLFFLFTVCCVSWITKQKILYMLWHSTFSTESNNTLLHLKPSHKKRHPANPEICHWVDIPDTWLILSSLNS